MNHPSLQSYPARNRALIIAGADDQGALRDYQTDYEGCAQRYYYGSAYFLIHFRK